MYEPSYVFEESSGLLSAGAESGTSFKISPFTNAAKSMKQYRVSTY
jgi:hypothetical protein|tara:strand:- start:15 stop:152 length:138 start_codon:yes stop_codon:yes gene_type:complete